MDESAALEDRFAGGVTHNGTTLIEQEIAEVAAWLLGEVIDGDAAAGAAAYAAGTCTLCHGPEAEGDVGPTLAGMDELAALEERYSGGASHNGNTLTDQEIMDVAAWLASL